MNDETIKTICWAVVLIFGIHSFAICALVRFLVTGKPIFQKRDMDREHAENVLGGRFGA